MKKILLSMTERQHSILKGMAKEKEISFSEFLRRLFDDTIEKSISKNTLQMMDAAMKNYANGIVSDPIKLEEVKNEKECAYRRRRGRSSGRRPQMCSK